MPKIQVMSPKGDDLFAEWGIDTWREANADALAASIPGEVERRHLRSLPPRHNPDQFRVRIRELPARTVAYNRMNLACLGERARKSNQSA